MFGMEAENTHTHAAHFVIDTVEESRHDRENGGLQGLHVIWQQPDVTLEESHPGTSAVYHRLHDIHPILENTLPASA